MSRNSETRNSVTSTSVKLDARKCMRLKSENSLFWIINKIKRSRKLSIPRIYQKTAVVKSQEDVLTTATNYRNALNYWETDSNSRSAPILRDIRPCSPSLFGRDQRIQLIVLKTVDFLPPSWRISLKNGSMTLEALIPCILEWRHPWANLCGSIITPSDLLKIIQCTTDLMKQRLLHIERITHADFLDTRYWCTIT